MPAHSLIPGLKSAGPAVSLSAWLILTGECTRVSRQNLSYHDKKTGLDSLRQICAPTTLWKHLCNLGDTVKVPMAAKQTTPKLGALKP